MLPVCPNKRTDQSHPCIDHPHVIDYNQNTLRPCIAWGSIMRVLVVDDNHDILELVQRLLLSEGHHVITARDGLEALQQEASNLPDMVICDVNLPRLDGWEVCRQIKARRNIPIMLLTVRIEAVDIERSRVAGADDHMSKPFDISEFLTRIYKLRPSSRPSPGSTSWHP